ncbi:MAG: ABC transporter permease subunit [Opitutaceae bacterium]
MNPDTVDPGRRQGEIPARFRVSRGTLRLDRFMTLFIRLGGIAVVMGVFGIFVFILVQIIPLFDGAKVTEVGRVDVPEMDVVAIGLDEWSELPLLVGRDGRLLFLDLVGNRGIFPPADPIPDLAGGFTAVRYDQRSQTFLFGLSDGRILLVGLNYRPVFSAEGIRTIEPDLTVIYRGLPGREGYPIADLAFGQAEGARLMAVLQEVDGRTELHAVALKQKRSLMGVGKLVVDARFDLTEKLTGLPVGFEVPVQSDAILVATRDGTVDYFFREADTFELRQVFRPFDDLEDPSIVEMHFLLGDVSLVLTNGLGFNRVFSLFQPEGSTVRQFGLTKDFVPLTGKPDVFAASLRNKAFLIGSGNRVSLRYTTTNSVRWEGEMPFSIRKVILGGKYDRILMLGDDRQLHVYELIDHHPEAGWRAFFGKIWYEGSPAPAYVWQSTGGSDEFEPKLSLIPLIVGSLKGTLYALLFAVPISILAAIYTSQFLKPGLKNVVKPTMEIMASLPSVVLGFLAALWLAPLIEKQVPALILMGVAVPGVAAGFGWLWSRLPYRVRNLIVPGWEFLVFAPILLLVLVACWHLGPMLERVAFVFTDPVTGERVADFRLWWPQVTGAPYEQRNSLVVGFMMGFAVIPIIFTISEDALSNVPKSIISGSLALGASRWQTARNVVLPTAAAGIFSALMIGLGRAVGETMIVVMATGNTPIMEMGIFSGMRTLSANIAVELPEAPQAGTLYRTLFLGALVLFLMTFVLNTFAEVLRQRLRDRYKVV